MPDDAAGTDDGEDRRRRPSGSDPDADYSIDERSVFDVGNSADRADESDEIDGRSRGDDGYRVPLDLSGDDDAAGVDADADEDDDDPYAPEPNSTPIEPGDPDLESVIFVFLGAIAMTLVLFRVMTLPL
ncbi:hypothetical protein Htur_0843 [Haloterrigena turkmenica DSM 5511]|uniref:DUF7312 domain-containing protein n=1 Tax=Haloterrigena turkmenica (strain ATCC 51198 / DSM 5511 / JCM 9101 / NCIMB 13204 / VKM B-1734 / 4k) TaxID=543526 RepID=D2RXQ4_HALTV|nr:hypothetical protein [Haloterrigena turkmenica]ADB59738.1 hypothetical protein Htur_0843 [Haloterrigena turkmenica DSM 5511]